MSTDNDPPSSTEETLSITEVERLTGIRPATLRMWERRYGFPQPLRDRHGERTYPRSQVERLHGARRLLDQGVRPGKIFAGTAELELPARVADAVPGATGGPYQPILDLLCAYRLAELHSHFQYRLLDLGLRRFVIEFLAPLTSAVGLAWGRGALAVRSEHVYTQLVMSVLHAGQASVRAAGERTPKAVLATLTGEAHSLGIMMAEAVLATHEVQCIQLGSDVAPAEVAAAAGETGADIVALSFSSYFPRQNALRMIRSLRAELPASTMLWVGGKGTPEAGALPPGVAGFHTLEAIEPALRAWRAQAAATRAPAARAAG